MHGCAQPASGSRVAHLAVHDVRELDELVFVQRSGVVHIEDAECDCSAREPGREWAAGASQARVSATRAHRKISSFENMQ